LFESYVKSIDQYDEEYFDIILVDGRSRPSCVIKAIPKLKNEGLLIVDNSERKAYKSALDRLDGWDTRSFFGPVYCYDLFSETTIFKKP
jgi:hypothetical protein